MEESGVVEVLEPVVLWQVRGGGCGRSREAFTVVRLIVGCLPRNFLLLVANHCSWTVRQWLLLL